MIYYNDIHNVIERRDKSTNKFIPFNISFVKIATGEIIDCTDVNYVSKSTKQNLIRVRLKNGQLRAFKKLGILKINSNEIKLD